MAERIIPAAPLPSAGAGTITTPFQFLVSGEDNLRIRVWDSAAGAVLLVSGRVVDTDGTIGIFSREIVLTGTRQPHSTLISLAPGYVLSVAAQIQTSSIEHAQCFIQVDLVRGLTGGLTTLGTLIQGYVASVEGLAYPGSPIVTPLAGPGRVYSLSLGSAAIGAQQTAPVPNGAAWRVLSWHATLVTSAVVGNRYVLLTATDVFTRIWWRAPSIYAQPAAVFTAYSWYPGATAQSIAAAGAVAVPLPTAHRLPGGVTFTTGVAGMDPGDQWQGLTLTVEEWIYPWSFGND